MENIREILKKFYFAGMYKATLERNVTYINEAPTFDDLYEDLDKSHFYVSTCRHKWFRTTKDYKRAWKCFECKKVITDKKDKIN